MKRKNGLHFWLLVAAVFVLDQGTKHFVQLRYLPGESQVVLPQFFHLTYVQNTGAAFGILVEWTQFFIGLTLVLLLVLFLYCRKFSNSDRLIRLALALVVGGGVGNLLDRLRLGYVVDFLDFRVWPVFNVADMAIVSGAIVLAFKLFSLSRDQL